MISDDLSTGASGFDESEVERCFRKRAAVMAKPAKQPDTREKLIVSTFRLGSDRFAIESKWVREVRSFSRFTPVPKTPSFIMGIVPVRGRLVALLDLRVLLDLRGESLSDRSHALILSGHSMEFALQVDAMQSSDAFDPHELSTSYPNLHPAGRKYLKGVACDGTVVLEGEALLRDPSLVVK